MMAPYDGSDLLERVRETILIGVHKLLYKNGAFKEQILKNTPVVDAMDILIRSPLTTHEEKGKLLTHRKDYIALQKEWKKATCW